MSDFGLLEEFSAKTPEGLQRRLVAALLDETRELGPEARRQLAALLQGGHGGFVATISRTKVARPTTDTLRNFDIYHAVNHARYLKRVGDRTDLPMEWREQAPLSQVEWKAIVDGVINRHNASCPPEDRWNPLNGPKAREQAFNRGFEAAMEYRRVQVEEND